jgi:hypothetical protein
VHMHDMFSVGAMDIVIIGDLHSGYRIGMCRQTAVRFGVNDVFGGVFSSFRLFCKVARLISPVEYVSLLLLRDTHSLQSRTKPTVRL